LITKYYAGEQIKEVSWAGYVTLIGEKKYVQDFVEET